MGFESRDLWLRIFDGWDGVTSSGEILKLLGNTVILGQGCFTSDLLSLIALS